MVRSDAPRESLGKGLYGVTLVITNRVSDACNCAGVPHLLSIYDHDDRRTIGNQQTQKGVALQILCKALMDRCVEVKTC
jgi:hypothetical protein